MATRTKKIAEDKKKEGEVEFVLPPKPDMPPRDGRQHKATYARDKYEGGYNVRVIGPSAKKMENRWVPVTRMDDTENQEFLTRLVWAGTDEDTGKPCAVYKMHKLPKEEADELPF